MIGSANLKSIKYFEKGSARVKVQFFAGMRTDYYSKTQKNQETIQSCYVNI